MRPSRARPTAVRPTSEAMSLSSEIRAAFIAAGSASNSAWSTHHKDRQYLSTRCSHGSFGSASAQSLAARPRTNGGQPHCSGTWTSIQGEPVNHFFQCLYQFIRVVLDYASLDSRPYRVTL